MRHPQARREAIGLVQAHDGHAKQLIETRLDDRLARGEIDAALHLDQVRREIEHVYEMAGES